MSSITSLICRENKDCFNRIQGCSLSHLQFVEKISIVIIVFKDVLYHIFNLIVHIKLLQYSKKKYIYTCTKCAFHADKSYQLFF